MLVMFSYSLSAWVLVTMPLYSGGVALAPWILLTWVAVQGDQVSNQNLSYISFTQQKKKYHFVIVSFYGISSLVWHLLTFFFS